VVKHKENKYCGRQQGGNATTPSSSLTSHHSSFSVGE
jgi:hypothetical protein